MNWGKVFGNIGGVALGCLAVDRSGVAGSASSLKGLGLGVLLCVISNQIGLHQEKPSRRDDGGD